MNSAVRTGSVMWRRCWLTASVLWFFTLAPSVLGFNPKWLIEGAELAKSADKAADVLKVEKVLVNDATLHALTGANWGGDLVFAQKVKVTLQKISGEIAAVNPSRRALEGSERVSKYARQAVEDQETAALAVACVYVAQQEIRQAEVLRLGTVEVKSLAEAAEQLPPDWKG
jgi:hypothetical protein